MIEILYLFLGYIPLTLISLTNYSFLITNSFIYTLIPLVSLYHNFTPYPVYYDIIAIMGNYLIAIIWHYLVNYNNFPFSKLVLISMKFLSNYFSLLIFLGTEYIYRFNNVWDSSFGLLLLSCSYLYYPCLHRIYYGHNKNSWKRKIDYYYSYFKKNYQFSFIYDIFEGIILGILATEWYNTFINMEYFYLGVGILKILYHYFKPLNLQNSSYFIIINIFFTLISIGLVFLNTKLEINYLFYCINGIIQLLHNFIYCYISPPKQYKITIRQSISLPDIYFNS